MYEWTISGKLQLLRKSNQILRLFKTCSKRLFWNKDVSRKHAFTRVFLRLSCCLLAMMHTCQNGIQNCVTIFFIPLGLILKIAFKKEAEMLKPSPDFSVVLIAILRARENFAMLS